MPTAAVAATSASLGATATGTAAAVYPLERRLALLAPTAAAIDATVATAAVASSNTAVGPTPSPPPSGRRAATVDLGGGLRRGDARGPGRAMAVA